MVKNYDPESIKDSELPPKLNDFLLSHTQPLKKNSLHPIHNFILHTNGQTLKHNILGRDKKRNKMLLETVRHVRLWYSTDAETNNSSQYQYPDVVR